MIDLFAESLLTPEEAAEKLKVSPASVYRWIARGSGGVRLEAAKLGGRWRTSEEAVQRFSDLLTGKDAPVTPPQAPAMTLLRRQKHLEEVDRRLDEMLGVRRCEGCRTEIAPSKCMIPKGERVWCPECVVKLESASLGLRIRTFRWSASLGQGALSKKTVIGIDKIRAYEQDREKPTEAHLSRLIEALGGEFLLGYKK